jgi:hypothetical protein
MRVSDDSTLLFVSTPTGVRVLSLPGMGSPPRRGPSAPPPLWGLDAPAGRPAAPAVLDPPDREATQVQNGPPATETGDFPARVDPPSPAQGRKTASAPGHRPGRDGLLPDDFDASPPQG